MESDMELNFRGVVGVLEIKAPIYYTPGEQLDKENYVYFRAFGDEEVRAIKNKTHDPSCIYDTTSAGLHLPDISVREYYEMELERNPFAINRIMKMIRSQMAITLDEIPMVIAVFAVLHELGHWEYFCESGMTPYEYQRKEAEERRPYEKARKYIYDMDDTSPLKLVLAAKYEDCYSQLPSEIAANQYAISHIVESVERVRDIAK